MDKQLCPTCGEILALSILTDLDLARRDGPVLRFDDDPVANLHCTEECGYRQDGMMTDLTMEISTGYMLSGTFIPEP